MSERSGREMIAELKITRPDVVIEVTRERDEYFRWDGDGPDPEEEGFEAYDVDVTARCIRNGEMVEGRDSLGGSYYKPDEALGEVHGYLPQMIDEALEELNKTIAAKEKA